MAAHAQARAEARETLLRLFPVGTTVSALTVDYRRRQGSSVYTVAVLASGEFETGGITNVSAEVANLTGLAKSRNSNAVVISGYPPELVGCLARELHGSSTALGYQAL